MLSMNPMNSIIRGLVAAMVLTALAIAYILTASGGLPVFHVNGSGAFGLVQLAANLGISTYAAKQIIDIILTLSDIALILSLIAAIVGAGVVTAGIVSLAKRLALRYGKQYAIAW
jgi:circularin A/uberolysin family circular bacteriocin